MDPGNHRLFLISSRSLLLLSEARFDGEDIYWLEGRPQESGRLVVVRANALDGHATDVTPKPYNARTRVREYGGASWTVANGDVYFSNFAGGRLYRQTNNSSHPVPLTPAPAVPEHQSCCSSASVGRGPISCMAGIRPQDGTGAGRFHRTFVRFSDDWLFVFLVIILVFFVLVIVVERVLGWRAQGIEMARAD
jgi:hypothetical protein